MDITNLEAALQTDSFYGLVAAETSEAFCRIFKGSGFTKALFPPEDSSAGVKREI
jgi:hypothetical protein